MVKRERNAIIIIEFKIIITIKIYRILDEDEFYIKQDLIKIEDYVLISKFLNRFIYQIITANEIGKKII